MKKMMTKPSDDEVRDARPVLWDKETERLIKAERASLLQYACYRLGDVDEAEDAVQDVCLNLLLRVKAEVRNPVAYLYRMLSNLCSTRLKESAGRTKISLEALPEPADSEVEDFEQEYRRVSLLLGEIPEEQAEVIRLRFYGDKSFREIADILGVPLTTAKSRFTYGLEKMKKIGMRN